VNDQTRPPLLALPPTRPRRLIYFGTPEASVLPLVALHEANFDIALVVSQPDRKRGRGSKFSPSPVKAAAIELGLKVTDNLDSAAKLAAESTIDLGVVVAYGRLIPTEMLVQLAMVNIHFSLLPHWRGAAPVERAILSGDAETGVCLMALAPKLDAGDIYACRSIPITNADTALGLRERLSGVGAQMVVDELTNGLSSPKPQVGEPTYARKITAEEHQLDLSLPADQILRTIRLGRAWTTYDNKRFKILHAEVAESADIADVDQTGLLSEVGAILGDLVVTGDGLLRLLTVQPEGRKAVSARDWINGSQPPSGARLV